MFNVRVLCICLYFLLNAVHSANILGVFPIPSVSHQVVFQPIWRELSLRGHKVTVVTTDPLKDSKLTNLTEIDMQFTYEVYRKNVLKYQEARSSTKLLEVVYWALGNTIKAELVHPTIQSLIKDQTKKFDVVLVEFIHPTIYAFAAKYNCPLVGIVSLGGLIPAHDAVGNPSHPVLNPDIFLPLYGKLSFFERLYSTYIEIWHRFHYNYYVIPREDRVAKKYIDRNLPYLGDIEKNVSLLLLNTNPIINRIRPNVPAVIEIGGVHINKRNPLSKDLQKELDTATKGAVYFSLGSNVKSANLSVELRKKIVEALSELPYKVLWKFEDPHLPDQPKNVIIREWLPQQDILDHPNVKVFLTQGGLQSMEEAISKEVPLVVMPFLGDQPVNAKKMLELGIARVVNPETLTKEKLVNALMEVAENPIYREKIKEISDLINDQPMLGLEKAIWWIEYVIRHKGARHLRSPAIDLPWYQYFLVDVLGFVLCITFICVFLLFKMTKLILRYLFKESSNKIKVS